MSNKLYIKTFGCQMNEYDSQKTVEILKEKKGMEITTNVEEADIILLNTCSIREKAEDKVYSELGRLNKLKINNPNIKIGVGGCVATQEGANITKRAPYVDLIYGPQTLNKVAEAGVHANVVSMPCLDIFQTMPEEYQASVVKSDLPILVAELSHPNSWYKLLNKTDKVLGIETFGESAPANILLEHFGFNVENAVEMAKSLVNE